MSNFHRHPFFVGAGALALAVGAALSPTPRAASQPPHPSPALAGTWQIEGDVEHARQTVHRAIQPALASLRPDMQRLARARLAETTWVPTTIRVETRADRIVVEYRGPQSRTFSTAPGEAENVYSRSGVRARMTQTYRPDGGIEQRFVAMDGTQYNFLLPQEGGHALQLNVLVRSPRFPQEIRFHIAYRRAG